MPKTRLSILRILGIGTLSLAFVTLLVAIGAYGAALQLDGVADHRPRNYEAYRQRSLVYPAMPTIVSNALSETFASTSEPADQRTLIAQEASSVFAWWMVLISAGSALITLFGTVLIYSQIRLTRKALTQASLATQEASSANEIAKEIGQAQVKAYLFLDSADVLMGRNGVHVRVTFQNSGSTPAKNICGKIRGDLILATQSQPTSMPESSMLDIEEIEFELGVISAGSHTSSTEISWVRPSQNEMYRAIVLEQKNARTIVLHIAGFVSWDDVFGKRQKVHFSTGCQAFQRENVGDKPVIVGKFSSIRHLAGTD